MGAIQYGRLSSVELSRVITQATAFAGYRNACLKAWRHYGVPVVGPGWVSYPDLEHEYRRVFRYDADCGNEYCSSARRPRVYWAYLRVGYLLQYQPERTWVFDGTIKSLEHAERYVIQEYLDQRRRAQDPCTHLERMLCEPPDDFTEQVLFYLLEGV